MDFQKLLEMQEELDNHIMKQHELPFIKLTKSVLATITELSEVCNDWQGFKYWKVNNAPRREVVCHACKGKRVFTLEYNKELGHVCDEPCLYCEGTGIQARPLIEEIADFTHFLAHLSNRFKVTADDINQRGAIKYKDIDEHFLQMHYVTSMIGVYPTAPEKQKYVKELWSLFKGLLEHLSFTEEQVFEAYLQKHEENYKRQRENY